MPDKYKILLTGGSGKLGQAIIKSGQFASTLSPSRKTLDITKPETIKTFFEENEVNAVIHCAALARMGECEAEPAKAIKTNIIGTSNLISAIKEKGIENKIRFIHISTDAVYPGKTGRYSEKDETIPYNKYGWTKLGAECAVNTLPNFCIIRTSFFDPKNIAFKDAPIDAYSSKMPISDLVKSIKKILYSGFMGTINVGGERESEYSRYKRFKPSLKKCRFEYILRSVDFPMARDASINCSLWKKMEKDEKPINKNK